MNIFKIATLSLLVMFFASCKKHYADSPAKPATNISASNGNAFTCGTFVSNVSTADFPLGLYPSFTATFAETVTWKIELTGNISTATKTISATSSFINASNSTWMGNHDGLYFFESGETVTANLIISGKAGVCSSTTFTIGSARDARTATPTFMLASNTGTNTSDFEGTQTFPYLFNIGGSTINTPQNQTIRAPEGVQYVHMEGVSTAVNGFFVGGLQSRINTGATTPHFFPITWTDPTKIYLNIYVRGIENMPPGNFPYATLNFECHEDDNNNMSDSSNCASYAYPGGGNPDSFCPSSEDSWVFTIPVRHIGWKLFSCKYSDLTPSADFANGGFGNKKLEPQKVCRVQFGMISSPPFNRVSVDMDYACFTYGAPYDPTK